MEIAKFWGVRTSKPLIEPSSFRYSKRCKIMPKMHHLYVWPKFWFWLRPEDQSRLRPALQRRSWGQYFGLEAKLWPNLWCWGRDKGQNSSLKLIFLGARLKCWSWCQGLKLKAKSKVTLHGFDQYIVGVEFFSAVTSGTFISGGGC